MTKEFKEKDKGGRPRVEFDWQRMDNILEFGARLLDCSELLGVSEDTIQNRVRERYGITFMQYRERKLSKVRMKVLQKMIDVGTNGNGNTTMLIWLSKNLLGWTDKMENNITTKTEIKMNKEEQLEMLETYKNILKEKAE